MKYLRRASAYQLAVLVAFVNLTAGCTSTKSVLMDRDELVTSSRKEPGSMRKIVKIRRNDGTTINFDKDGGRYMNSYLGQDSVVVGVAEDGAVSFTGIAVIDTIWVENSESDTVGTAGLILGGGFVAAAVLGVVLFATILDRIGGY